LPCALLATHGKEIFAVQQLTAKLGCTAAPDFPVVMSIRANFVCIRLWIAEDGTNKTIF
jgi:hypothetical protein